MIQSVEGQGNPRHHQAAVRAAIAALAGAAATAMLVSGTGLAAASIRPAVAKTERFQIMSTSFPAAIDSLVASGAFTAGGITSSSNHVVKLPGGTFRLVPRAVGGHQRVSPATCLVTISQHGTYKISHGTGKYAGISGSGHFRLSILIVDRRNSHGACTLARKPFASELIASAQGPVTLP